MRIAVALVILALLLPVCPLPAAAQSDAGGPLPLSAYPRPPHDNGLGIHWSTTVYGQPPAVVDYFVGELAAMNVRWVKFLNDGTEGRHNEYLVQQLVTHGIMPIMRIYLRCNRDLDLASLRRLVQHYAPLGVYYYEFYNEPELPGVDGGWCDNERPDPAWLAGRWIPAARIVQENGGFPAVPALFPPSLKDANWHDSFFARFYDTVSRRGETKLLYRSWAAVHNYFLNHPVDYPYDEVNRSGRPLMAAEIAAADLGAAEVSSINAARAIARRPRSEGGYYVGDTPAEDTDNFLGFIAYHDRFYDLFGFEIPLISTEGGVQVGSSEDPRYPKVTEKIMAERTLQACAYMLERAPAYYFAFTTWLLAEGALGRYGSAWESWAWYHDRAGNHLPVVEQLKANPRRAETRTNAPASGAAAGEPINRATPPPTPVSTPLPSAPGDARLNRFPRPAGDNGWGIHWTPSVTAQSTDLVDRFVNEAGRLGIKWVKIMQPDQAKVEHEYLIRSLVGRGIMPILRVYRPYNTPYEHLPELVAAARPLGVYYYELYNEPNVAGEPGGWASGQEISPERLAALWLPAAQAVIGSGGFPGVPALAPGGDYDDLAFLRLFLEQVVAAGGSETLASSWLALHNYFLNHPPDYPQDPVNLRSVPMSMDEATPRGLGAAQVEAINRARALSRQPRSEGGYYVGDTIDKDSNGFHKFEAYESIVRAETGLTMPILTTEGGAIPGTQEDPRYPPVTDADVAAWTVTAYRYMLEQAPSYYFTFTPWLLANAAGGGRDPQWERAAWFAGYGAAARPVVAAVAALAAEGGARRSVAGATPREETATPAPIAAPALSASLQGGWVVVWRDRQLLQCVPALFTPGRPLERGWNPPADGSAWGLDVRNAEGARLAAFGATGPDGGGLPWLCGSPAGQFTALTPAPAATPPPSASAGWDARLDALGVSVQRADAAGGNGWRLVRAAYEDETEAGGRHHIYVRLLDAAGRDTVGIVEVAWAGGQQALAVAPYEGANPDPYARYGANFPMYGPLGSYTVRVPDGGDSVLGLGLPAKRHVNYILTFQRLN